MLINNNYTWMTRCLGFYVLHNYPSDYETKTLWTNDIENELVLHCFSIILRRILFDIGKNAFHNYSSLGELLQNTLFF